MEKTIFLPGAQSQSSGLLASLRKHPFLFRSSPLGTFHKTSPAAKSKEKRMFLQAICLQILVNFKIFELSLFFLICLHTGLKFSFVHNRKFELA